jgi:hypothetical protein
VRATVGDGTVVGEVMGETGSDGTIVGEAVGETVFEAVSDCAIVGVRVIGTVNWQALTN